MTKLDVLLGLQWGDEGKGKIVDALTPEYDVIARFQGGPNAGHTLEFNQIKHVLHTIPSGIFHPRQINVIGSGVVIDPVIFKKEIDLLLPHKINLSHLYISKKAHLILPSHRALDRVYEEAKGAGKIGSTLKGIGPTYTDKIGRSGLRVGDIFTPDFKERYNALVEKHRAAFAQYGADIDLTQEERAWFEAIELIRSLTVVNSEYVMNQFLGEGKKILAEGAQGTLLDIDFGSYPFVTSSNTVCAGACTGLGVAPGAIGRVFGIVKAYCTRVGSGPFPTELHDAVGEELRAVGHEFGSTTGRPRRCGWLDLPALKYAVMVNGVTDLILTKPDVLSGFDQIKVCTAYKVNGEITQEIPFDVKAEIEPIYTSLPGWKSDISHLRTWEEVPTALKAYIAFVEEQMGVPFRIISVGPNRKETIFR
ncbi:MAG: adenylosuccinate synthase [Bacteroidales bacterium]